MGYYSFPLEANVPYQHDSGGTLILVDGIDGAAGIDITPILNGNPQRTMPGRKIAFKYRTPFDAVVFKAPAACTLRIFLTTDDVSLGFADGAQVNVLGTVNIGNGADTRVPVDIAGGSVTVTADNVGVSNTDANPVPVRSQALNTLVDHAPALINTGVGQLLVNDPTFWRLRVRNAHATAIIALGGAALTMANAAIVLHPGDTWLEDDAAGAPWYATSDTDGADVRVMGVK